MPGTVIDNMLQVELLIILIDDDDDGDDDDDEGSCQEVYEPIFHRCDVLNHIENVTVLHNNSVEQLKTKRRYISSRIEQTKRRDIFQDARYNRDRKFLYPAYCQAYLFIQHFTISCFH